MTTTLTRTATPTQVDLDTRLAIADASMTLRLEQAQLRFDVNTAHQPNSPVVELEFVDLPALAPQPQGCPLAAVFLAAINVIRARGWTRGGLRDEQGAVCAVEAIRAAAGPDRGRADDACARLLDVIQQHFQADTLPSWNDAQTNPDTVIRMLNTAANLH
jgi:hypothetical protein